MADCEDDNVAVTVSDVDCVAEPVGDLDSLLVADLLSDADSVPVLDDETDAVPVGVTVPNVLVRDIVTDSVTDWLDVKETVALFVALTEADDVNDTVSVPERDSLPEMLVDWLRVAELLTEMEALTLTVPEELSVTDIDVVVDPLRLTLPVADSLTVVVMVMLPLRVPDIVAEPEEDCDNEPERVLETVALVEALFVALTVLDTVPDCESVSDLVCVRVRDGTLSEADIDSELLIVPLLDAVSVLDGKLRVTEPDVTENDSRVTEMLSDAVRVPEAVAVAVPFDTELLVDTVIDPDDTDTDPRVVEVVTDSVVVAVPDLVNVPRDDVKLSEAVPDGVADGVADAVFTVVNECDPESVGVPRDTEMDSVSDMLPLIERLVVPVELAV